MKLDTNPQPNQDPLDALLHEAGEHLPDNGFTARVVGALPPRRPAGRLRLVVLSLAVLLGGALAAWQLPSFSGLLLELPQQLRVRNLNYLLALLPAVTVLASLGWGVYALVNDEA